MIKLCRKCGQVIPPSYKVDGKRHNLASRKFCLVCVPFGTHNTRKNIDIPCGFYPGNIPWKDWPEEWKERSRRNSYERGVRLKRKLVEMLGGKCSRCGYHRCIVAMHFHHRDAKQKLFQLDMRTIRSKQWAMVLAEVHKCDLLCANCHIEQHHKLWEQNDIPPGV